MDKMQALSEYFSRNFRGRGFATAIGTRREVRFEGFLSPIFTLGCGTSRSGEWPKTTTFGRGRPTSAKSPFSSVEFSDLSLKTNELNHSPWCLFGTALASPSGREIPRYAGLCSQGWFGEVGYEKQILSRLGSLNFGVFGRILDQRSGANDR
jgi:hypothetical protein